MLSKNKGNLFIISAPSGAGKSSLVNALLSNHQDIVLSLSCTTRDPRPGEQNNREYMFVSIEEFNHMRDNNELLEWAQVHGNFYGTPNKLVSDSLNQGLDVILEIDWQGAQQIKQNHPDAIGIFILPPSIETLEQRLIKRGQDSQEVINRRLAAANQEIAHAPEFEYVIINQEFNLALEQLSQIVNTARLQYNSQLAGNLSLFKQFNIA